MNVFEGVSRRFNAVFAPVVFLAAMFLSPSGFGQTKPLISQPDVDSAKASDQAQQENKKRIFWIFPQYDNPSLENYKPFTVKEKFKYAADDAFDRRTVLLAAIQGGLGQWEDSNPSFGQGGLGFGRYTGAAYGNLVIGDFMSEAIFPSMFHQDPRYFRKGTGGKWARLRYAVGQVIVTHGDNKQTEFNYSEILGNASAVAISNAYYVDQRDVGDSVTKFGVILGSDMGANVFKEFWPDIRRKLFHGTATP